MSATNQQERRELAANNPYIHQAQDLLEAIAQNPEERAQYEDRLKGLMDYYSGLSAERKAGEQAGMQAQAERIAKNMLSKNMDISTVASFTGLPIDAIEKMLKSKDF